MQAGRVAELVADEAAQAVAQRRVQGEERPKRAEEERLRVPAVGPLKARGAELKVPGAEPQKAPGAPAAVEEQALRRRHRLHRLNLLWICDWSASI